MRSKEVRRRYGLGSTLQRAFTLLGTKNPNPAYRVRKRRPAPRCSSYTAICSGVDSQESLDIAHSPRYVDILPKFEKLWILVKVAQRWRTAVQPVSLVAGWSAPWRERWHSWDSGAAEESS